MTVRDSVAEWVGTWLGCGRARWAPGTVGTLGALPLYWLMRSASPWTYWGLVAGLCLLGVWAAQAISKRTGTEDPQRVVIDEVTGVLIALGMVRAVGWPVELVAVVLFRVFDILKPGPVAWAEYSKPAGLGIMADDWVAGLLAGALSMVVAPYWS